MTALPAAFVQRMRLQLGQSADAFFDAMQQPPVRGLRINPFKQPNKPLRGEVPGIGDAVPWEPDGWYLSPESPAGVHPLHACGAFYLQEASAMLPARLLRPKPGEIVLDLCAAPGGKSTQLAAMMQGQGTIVCNEIVPSRAAVLSGNVERMGIPNAVVVSADPSLLEARWPQLFDAILVDAPCSGEGMFRRHPETQTEWTIDSPARCARRQAHILQSAARMLKTGGRLCYSTCTFSDEENEGIIDAFLQSHPEFRPVEYSVTIHKDTVLASQNGCIRLYPHIVRGEGHFAALLEKAAPSAEEQPAGLLAADAAFSSPDPQIIHAFHAFWQDVSAGNFPQPDAIIGSLLISAPPLPPLGGIKTYRAGLSLGRMKGKVFMPDHALALAAPPPAIRTIPLDQAAAAEYLGGEVLPVEGISNGFWTVSYAGLPLGFVKHSDHQLKNHYPKGLRNR